MYIPYIFRTHALSITDTAVFGKTTLGLNGSGRRHWPNNMNGYSLYHRNE